MLSVNELVLATNGYILNGDKEKLIKKYSINSKEVDKDTWFIPIVGESIDAHEYIVDCAECGIVGTYISKNTKNKEQIIQKIKEINKDICIIEVEDTKKALKDSGVYNRNKHSDIDIIGVTGSVGKTSTREMIASVLSEKYIVLKTIKNYNSEIGLPLMLLMIEDQDVCVFEMGMDGFGQLDELSKMAKPKIGVITNIGTSHIGNLGSRENIFKAKMEITNYLKADGTMIVNGEDEYLSKLNGENICKYSLSEVSDIKLEEESTYFKYTYNDEKYDVVINEAGKHQIMNALASINVGISINMRLQDIISGISKFKNYGKRMEKIKLNNNITLIDDSYNASFDSMKSGLDVFEKMNFKRKIIVLGDMLELGDYSKKLHENVGEYVNNLNFDFAIFCGKDAKFMYEASNVKNKIYFKEKDEVVEYLKSLILEDDAIYFKASNGMKFIDIINSIREYINK